MLRSQALREAGLFDDGFFLYFEEVELMHRLKQHGWVVHHVPSSRVVHIEGAATGLGPRRTTHRLPAYWYQSRRRYFTLTGGRSNLIAANAALLGGDALAALKGVAGRPVQERWGNTGDLLKLGFWPRRQDTRPCIRVWGETPGEPPAWMLGK
jgi:GT2 family glycosyltransferase